MQAGQKICIHYFSQAHFTALLQFPVYELASILPMKSHKFFLSNYLTFKLKKKKPEIHILRVATILVYMHACIILLTLKLIRYI